MAAARRNYESRFSDMFGGPSARAFGMGRHALVVLLKALGLRAGEGVGVCGYTCLSVAEAVKVAGGQCVYLDVDDRLCIAPESLEALAPGSLKAIVLQYTFGVPGQLPALLRQADRLGAVVIEDCAHALGSRWNDTPLGLLGDGAVFSFEWGKGYSTGQGGMLLVNRPALASAVDETIAALARPAGARADLALAAQRLVYRLSARRRGLKAALRALWRKLTAIGLIQGSFSHESIPSLDGYVRLAGPRMARAGLKQLDRWPARMRLRRENAARIAAALSARGLPVWNPGDGALPVMTRYPVLVPDKQALLAEARAAGLDLAGWYDSPVHPLQADRFDQVDYRPGLCPNAERLIARVVHLPTDETLTPRSLDRTMDMLARAFSVWPSLPARAR